MSETTIHVSNRDVSISRPDPDGDVEVSFGWDDETISLWLSRREATELCEAILSQFDVQS